MALSDFVRGAFSTALRPEELLEGVRVPKLSQHSRWSFYRVRRAANASPDAIGAVVVDPERGFCRTVLSGRGRIPRVLPISAERLIGTDAADSASKVDPGPRERNCCPKRLWSRPARGSNLFHGLVPCGEKGLREMKPAAMKQVAMTVNGRPITESVEPRMSLADFLRDRLQLTELISDAKVECAARAPCCSIVFLYAHAWSSQFR